MKAKTIKIHNDRDISKCRKIDEILYLAEMMNYEKNISPNSFEGSAGLFYVVCGDKTKTVGKRAFANCKNLVRFDGALESVSAESFIFCSSLKSFNFSTLSELANSAFSYSGLHSIELSSNIKIIPQSCFAGCINLKQINLSDVEIIEDNAFQLSTLQYIKLQNPLKHIGKKAFDGNMLLTDIFIECIVPPKIYASTFYGCPIHNIYFYSYSQYDAFLKDKAWSKYKECFQIISPSDTSTKINKIISERDFL